MSKRRVIAVIPARMASSRFPGKPLVPILGLPMIEHVRRRVCLSKLLDGAYVATCDPEIKGTVERFGGKALMTADTHQRCTDRVTEAVGQIVLADDDIVAIVSGDEPLFPPELLELSVDPMLKNPAIECTNIVSVIIDEQDMHDKDIVKVVLDTRGRIMCFSRSPLPYRRVKSDCVLYRQTGLAAFTKSFLFKFSTLAPTPLEMAESVDFMRILEHGYDIQAVVYNRKTIGVDQKEHVPQVEELLRHDPQHLKIYQEILALK